MEAILTLGLRILHNEDCPMPGGRFSIVPRLFLPDAHDTTTLSHHEERLQTLPNVLWGAEVSLVENHWFRGRGPWVGHLYPSPYSPLTERVVTKLII